MSQVNVAYFFSPSDRADIKTAYLNDVSNRLPKVTVKNSDDLFDGDDIQAALDKLVESADVIVLFLSIDFRNSDFFKSNEGKIRQKFDRHRAEVILVYLKSHSLSGTSPLYSLDKNFFPSKYEAIIKDEEVTPLQKWTDLSKEIETAVRRVISKKVKVSNPVFEFVANLCNRKTQREQITALYNRRNAATSKPSPLVLFVHGSPEENLDNYRDRLKRVELKKVLNVGKVHSYQDILWSKHLNHLTDMPKYLRQGLSNRLFENTTAGKAEIVARLGENISPVMISYRLNTMHWKKVETDYEEKEFSQIVEEFLDFWNGIKIENSDVQIIVCLFFEYNKTDDAADVENYKNANASAKRFFRREKRPDKSSMEDLADYQKFRLPFHWFPVGETLPDKRENETERFDNLFGIVLDELPPVSLSDVNEWSIEKDTTNAFQEVCPKPEHHDRFCDAVALVEAVGKYYEDEDPNHDGLPMRRLTEILVEEFEVFRCKD